MSISYFKQYGKWLEISRSEVLFCSYLYHSIKDNENEFIKWLSENQSDRGKKLIFNKEEFECEWEIGYEVCFYRDYLLKVNSSSVKNSDYSQKRTFDLCLFSEKRIIIIEAKSQDKFKSKDLNNYSKDINNLKSLLGYEIQVNLLALTSSRYLINQAKFGNSQFLNVFYGFITWKDIYSKYQNRVFFNAENCYKNQDLI